MNWVKPWWPIAAIEKKLSKSKKNFHNRKKTFRIEKKILESRKIFQSQKKLWNLENRFKIEKNISESRKIFRNPEKYFRIEKTISKSSKTEKYFVNSVEKKSWIQWPWIQWTSQLTFTCLKSTIETLENGVKCVQS